ncbi:MAG: hypothetical protein AB1679_36300 [Actinomycetota bacterium]
MRRRKLLAAVVPLALLTFLPTVQAGAALGPPAELGGGEGGNGFHGFAQFETHAQGQVVTLTGFLNAYREDNSIVGAVSEINGPPATSRNIAAFFFRGKGATFVYGVIGGPGGGRGTLPDPPPGEANAYYPTDDPPYEMTWSGPITGLGLPQVVDSRFHAKATDTPTGRTDGAVTALSSPNHFEVGQATVTSHTEPAEGGVVAEAVSVMHQVKVGPLTIQNIVSRAYAFVPTSGDPKGIASTVVEGAKVGDTPVQITDQGLIVADQKNPLQQEQVNKAMADAGFPQVRLLPSVAKAGEDGSSVTTTAGTLEFVKHDEAFGASNPQGFAGGGFSIGGAEAYVNTRRCDPDCGGGSGGSSDVVGGGTGDSPVSGDGASTSSSDSYSSDTLSSDSLSTDPAAATAAGTADAGGYGADSAATFSSDSIRAGLGASGGLASGSGGGLSGSDASAGAASGSTTAETPSSGEVSLGVQAPGDGVEVQQQAAVSVVNLGPKSAEWVRDLYLMAGLALGIIFVGQRLARAFS